MRIIELEIIGFGKLSDKKYNFDSITSILQSNGEGKSTLASFIESMFYGIDAKGSTLREYKPWASDFFGGNITIGVGDKIYRIERTFGTKKSDDTFKIYLMPEKKPTLDYSEKIGEELFGIDRSGFKRTCLFTHEQYRGGESSISSRINSLVADTDEFNDFEKITANLSKEIKTYENAQHRGKIPDIKREIEEVRIKISSLETAPILYNQKTQEKQVIANGISQIKKDITLLDTQIEQKLVEVNSNSNHKAIEVLQQRETELNAQLDKSKSQLNGNNITHQTLQIVAEEKKKLDQAEKALAETNNALLLNPTSNKPLPSQEEIELNKVKLENNTKMQAQRQKIEKIFKRKKVKSICLIIIATMLLVVGGITLNNYLFVSIPAITIALAFLGIGILNLVVNPTKKLNSQLFNLSSQVDEFLRTYGYGGYEPHMAINLMQAEYQSQLETNAKIATLTQNKIKITGEIEQFKRNIDGFFAKFNLYGSVEENLYILKSTLDKIEQTKISLEQLRLEKIKYSTPTNTTASVELENLKNQKKLKEQELSNHLENLQNNQTYSARLVEQISLLETLTEKRKYLQEELKKLENERFVLEQTLQGLIDAKHNLTSGAYEPIKKSLQTYCSKLMPTYSGFNVDTDFNVTYEFGGVTREFSTLSEGQKQLVEFSLRLGLIDALFTKEKPFIIIDDAFSLLDSKNFALCKQLVEEIGKNMQVIYFTPHQSRTI